MKIASILGARPQFIKVAPLCREFAKHPDVRHLIIHTDQHYDYSMSRVFFDELGIAEPDYHLEVRSGTHGYQTGEMLKRVEKVLTQEKPDWVVVYGDTNSTLAAALASVKMHIAVAHIEAGLRSFNRSMPEEINRVVTDHVSELLFCPTQTAVTNLQQEGIMQGVHLVGDIMYDSALFNVKLAARRSSILQKLNLEAKDYALVTVHRAENTERSDRLMHIFRALEKIAQDGMKVVVPLHPRTRKKLKSLQLSLKNLQVIEPVSYLDMLLLEKQAKMILTDSGGVQKEAFFFEVPCVTLRNETEWIETVESGWNVLADVDEEKIVSSVRISSVPSRAVKETFGNGQAAERICGIFSEMSTRTACCDTAASK